MDMDIPYIKNLGKNKKNSFSYFYKYEMIDIKNKYIKNYA